jgi:hypothetical protein
MGRSRVMRMEIIARDRNFSREFGGTAKGIRISSPHVTNATVTLERRHGSLAS